MTEDLRDSPLFVMSYEESVGTVVKVNTYGIGGDYLATIEGYDEEKEVIFVEDVLTGKESHINMETSPAGTTISIPFIGEEHTVYWKEHKKGDGEWAMTTPYVESQGAANLYFGKYKGKERTRVLSKTYTYIPEGVQQFSIRLDREGEPECVIEEREDSNYPLLDKIYHTISCDIDIPNSDLLEVGEIFIDKEEDEIVWFNVSYHFQKRSGMDQTTAVDLIKGWREVTLNDK